MFRFPKRASPTPPDNEIEQAVLRIAVSLGIYVCLLPAFFGGEAHPAAARVSMALLGFLALSVGILVVMRLCRRCAPWPRLIGNVADVAMTSFSMIATGLDGAALFFVYLFITIGNGFRFGRRYLDISLALSLAGFAVVATTEPFWRANRPLAAGVAIGLVAISLYARTLIRRLYSALDRAEVANEAKRRFLSTVTHELRTPLNAIQGMHDLLRETALDGHQRELLASIDTASHAMLGLVEDVLDFSKIEAGKVVLEDAPFDLNEMVGGVARLLAPQAARKGLDFVIRVDPAIDTALRGDAFRLRQVLLNLAGNALKFTEVGRVELTVERVEEAEGDGQARAAAGSWCERLRFSIRDTGIGMTPQALARIFDSFTQADSSTTRRFGGTGLGTTISRQLVQLFGGDLRVESAPGVGSRFWFEIALARADAGATIAGGAVAGDGAAAGMAADAGGEAAVPRCLLVGFGAREVTGEGNGEARIGGATFERVADTASALHAILDAAREQRPFGLVAVRAGLPTGDIVELAAGLHRYDDAPPLLLCDPEGDERVRALCRVIGYAEVLAGPPDPAALAGAARRLGAASAAGADGRAPDLAPGSAPPSPARRSPADGPTAAATPAASAFSTGAAAAAPAGGGATAASAGVGASAAPGAATAPARSAAAEPPGLVEQFRAHGGRPGLAILVADDNPINREVARRILELADCRVHLVDDGEQALDAAEQQRFDLILLDMNMPGMGGMDVARMLAHVEAGRPRTPLVMLTANARTEVIDEARGAGIDHFLSKPVGALKLLLTVAEATRLPPGRAADIAPGPRAANDEPPGPARLIDPGRLDELTRLGPDFMARLGQRFGADSCRLLAAMDRALAEQHVDALARLVRELGGVGQNLGATGLGARCESIAALPPAVLRAEGHRLVEQLAEASAEVHRALADAGTARS